MGSYDPNYDDVSNFLNFPNDSDDEEGSMNLTHHQEQKRNETKNNNEVKTSTSTPLSPPNSAEGDAIEEDEYDDDDDLYSGETDLWKMKPETTSVDNPVNPRWLHSSDAPVPRLAPPDHHPSPPTSDDAKTPSERRTVLDTIQERNEQLVKTSANPKSSKSFPLLPDLLRLKQAEDEDEKILASEEGKKLNPRERRQLRNKVSARNFRVRRKEYISHLESLVDQQGQEIESLRQSLNAVQLENTQLRQESGFLRSLALNQQSNPQQTPAPDSVMSGTHPNKDINPNTFDWPLAYDGSQPQSPVNSKFGDHPMFGGGHIQAYGVRVPEVPFDKPHMAATPAPPLPLQAPGPYPPNSPRSSQEAPKTPPGHPAYPPPPEGYPHMLQAVWNLYDYIVKASSSNTPPVPPLPQTYGHYPAPQGYQPPPQPQPQQWGDGKVIGAPALGYQNQYYNGNWGWNGGPPGPTV